MAKEMKQKEHQGKLNACWNYTESQILRLLYFAGLEFWVLSFLSNSSRHLRHLKQRFVLQPALPEVPVTPWNLMGKSLSLTRDLAIK